MLKEKAFGIIPIKRKNEVGEYLIFLVQLKSGNHWGFPKGHPEPEETDFRLTAIREFKEETNLDVVRFFIGCVFS